MSQWDSSLGKGAYSQPRWPESICRTHFLPIALWPPHIHHGTRISLTNKIYKCNKKLIIHLMCVCVCVCDNIHVAHFSAVGSFLLPVCVVWSLSCFWNAFLLLSLPNSDCGAYTARVCTSWTSPRPSLIIFKYTFNCCTKCSRSKYLRHW